MNSQDTLLAQQAEKISGNSKKDSIEIEAQQSSKLSFIKEDKTVAAAGSNANTASIPQVDQKLLLEKTIYKLRGLFAEIIKLPIDRIDADEPLEAYGIDSIMIVEFNKRLANIFGELSKTLFFEYRTLEAFAGYLTTHYLQDCVKWTGLTDQRQKRSEVGAETMRSNEIFSGLTSLKTRKNAGKSFNVSPSKNKREPIAIIGMSGRYPQAKNLNEYWRNLEKGKDCITEVPEERWPLEGFFNPDVQEAITQGKSYSKWGGFLEGFADFDALFFSILPREAINMDPQERCFIESCWEVLEDAGYTKQLLATKYDRRVGVFAGINKTGFNLYGPDLWKQGEKIFPHTQFGSVANRVSYLLNLQGPSMPIDTMCSSSLTAIHEACDHIQNGECEMAIAGGVNLYLHPSNYIQLCNLHMLSADGQCKSFGQDGNGFVPGEGVGAILLKRLSQAIEDKDHIYAVIRATSINHGGKTNGYTVPNPTAQGELIRAALDKAGVDARLISYIEAHGTGTALGDPIEITGLTKAFEKDTQESQFCAIGSVKSNIGHLEAAAGIAGVTKVVLQMNHKKFAPSLHSKNLNPNIDFTKTPFVVQQELAEWKQPAVEINGETKIYPRIAGISSFGAGGANAHVLIEEYIPKDKKETPITFTAGNPAIAVLSARNEDQLKKQVQQLLDTIRDRQLSDNVLADLVYTLQVGREAMEERLAVAVKSMKELEEKLQGFLKGQDGISDLYQGQVKRNKETVSIFKADEELQEATEKWIERGKYTQLMEFWVKGLNFDWEKLYDGIKPHRISLPTYPFAREHYWLPKVAIKSGITTSKFSGVSLHPLLQQNTSDFNGLRYSSTFSGQEFFLADHLVNGQCVLPGVAFLEIARAAVEQAEGLGAGRKSLQLKDVVWSNPIVVNEQSKVHIGLYPDENGEIAYEIYEEDDNTEQVIYNQGTAVVNPAKEVPTLDLKSLQAECSQGVLGFSECYETFKAMGIEYGAAYKGVEKVYVGAGQVLAKLSLPDAVANTSEQYVLHPSLMDSALQASIGLLGSGNLKPVLPFTLQNIEIIGNCRPAMWAFIRYSEKDKAKGQSLDLDLCDENGTVCVSMRGYSTRSLEAGSILDSIGTVLFSPYWQANAVERETAAPDYARHLVMLCEPDNTLRKSVEMKMEGVDCISLQSEEEGIDKRFQTYTIQVFEEIKNILATKPKGKVMLQIVVTNQNEQQVFSGLSGLLKTARLENPKIIGQLIEIEAGEDDEIIGKLKENSRSPIDSHIRYQNGTRYVSRLSQLETPQEQVAIPWKEKGIYLITGGAGGLGLIFAKEIARKTKGATLIVTGRSVLSENKQAKLQELRSLGVRIEYRQVDVTDKEAVAALIQSIKADFKGLNGIIHAAGLIRDNFIIKKTSEEVQKVLLPKVSGVVNLDQACSKLPLDFLILFSSAAGPLGNPGQADYSAANAFLDAYARYRNSLVALKQRYGQTIAMNWPLWKEGGMRVDKETEKLLNSEGIITLQTSSGVKALYQSLVSGKEQVMVIEGDIRKIREKFLNISSEDESHLLKLEVPEVDPGLLREKTLYQLKMLLAKVTQMDIGDFDDDEPLEDYGIDSIIITQLNHELVGIFGDISKTLFYEYQTLGALVDYFIDDYALTCRQWAGLVTEARKKPEISRKPLRDKVLDNKVPILTSWKKGKRQRGNYICTNIDSKNSEPIAIIGISGRYPQARTPQDYWINLESGKDCITEIPQDRWPLEGFFQPDKEEAVAQGKSYSKWGGFIDNFTNFDPLFFNISLRDARNMDPQERLFVESCWELFEDAGYTKEQLAAKYNNRIGVFAGITKTGFELYGPDLWKQGEKIFPHTSFSSVANRVSYLLNLHGPSMPIDTMCSSSLTAIHEACEHLNRGECAMAIAGGVNLYLHPSSYIGLCTQQMLSIDGQCKSFGKGGNGFVPGEGVGVVLLKRLSQAVADEDHIYAVIRGTSVNHGGKTNGYTVPNPTAQGEVIRDALDKAGVNARAVSYIEAHGTGTELGDPIEITGLSQAFRKDTQDTEFCSIGSAKSNIGHLEAAAGIAGITKIVLQMQHKKIVPSLHAKELNPNINFSKTPFSVQQDLAEWKRPVVEINGVSKEYPRIAGISAFGAGGSNAHVIIEEYIPRDTEQSDFLVNAQNPAIIVLSAKNEDCLKARVQQLLVAIQKQKLVDSDLAHIAYTLQVGREAMKDRLALLVGSMKEMEEKLREFIAGKNGIEGLYQGMVKRDKDTLNLFAADEDLQQVIDIWAQKGKYAKLLDLWVKGLGFDWNKLYGAVKPHRISLPAYPFAGEKFWIPEIRNKKCSELLYQDERIQTSKPLKGRWIASPLKEKQFEYIMSTENFTELRDNHNILHVGYYQEILCDAVKAGFNASSYVINNIEFLTALRFDEGVARVVNLILSPEDENGFMKFQVSSRETGKNKWTLHVKGSLKIIRDIQVDKLSIEQYPDINKFEKQYTADEFYQKIFEQGFRLGDSVKWVDQVWHRKDEIVARFRPFTEEEKKYNYSIGIHPGVLDACAQLFVFVGQEYLPLGTIFMVVEMKEFSFDCAGNRDKAVWCHFVLDKVGQDGDYIQGNYTLYDEDGLILAQARGKKAKKLNIKGLNTIDLNRSQAEKSCMQVEGLEESLRQIMAEQLGMLPEQLDTGEPLRDLGMDSIAAMNFRSMVEKSLGMKIPAEDLLEGPCIKELAATLDSQVQQLNKETKGQEKTGTVEKEELEESLRQIMAEQLGMLPEQLDTGEPLRDLGMDSIAAMNFRSMVEKSLGIKIPAEDLLEGPCIKDLAAIIQTELQNSDLEPKKVEKAQEQSKSSNKWYAHRIINKDAKFRLFCIPFGGGGASMYREWQEKLPDYIEVCPVQMPGKENRIKEVPIDHIDDAIDALEEAIKADLDIPYAFFGHSLGSLLGYRLAYRLWQTAKNKPSHLFVGAFSRPCLTPNFNFGKKIVMLKSRGFDSIPTASEVEKLSVEQLNFLVNQIGGMEKVVVEEDIARKLVAQAMADLRICESFKFKEEPLFDIPITAFHGMTDERVPEEDMQAWKLNTTSAFKIHLLSGNHFFLNKEQNQDELLAHIKEDIDLHIS